jgi:hypothetical protein
MDMDDIAHLFGERPFKMTSLHRGLLVRMIAVVRAAEEYAETEHPDAFDHLTECLEELRDFEE